MTKQQILANVKATAREIFPGNYPASVQNRLSFADAQKHHAQERAAWVATAASSLKS